MDQEVSFAAEENFRFLQIPSILAVSRPTEDYYYSQWRLYPCWIELYRQHATYLQKSLDRLGKFLDCAENSV